MKDKYVKLIQVEELLKLIDKRDKYYDWSDEYEKYDRKIAKTVEWLREQAIDITIKQ